ncbi:MAG: GDSL-type esterase/lipase family protein [Candidatus Bathyarchaeota archaeon]|nr:GDSL-type esterase/lipase family protein [Candidatus Bathyarchaeum tardum]WGM90506.1 MAG: GDSL-type esterase/lipase family protein [Candidatus Bathyarchaeum tardum]
MITKKPLFAIAIIALISCSGLMALSVQPQTITNDTIRVACVGDSITFGFGYPESLQTKLGDNYNVNNFGVSASTVVYHSSKPYVNQNAFRQSKAFHPEIVIIMLGTNDAQSNINGGIDNFSSDYKELINNYQSLPTNPEIWLVTPPPIYYNDYYWDNMILEQQVIPQIKQVAIELDLPTIDINTALTDYPEYFGDGIHPNIEGVSIITETIYQAISTTG